MSHPVSAAKQLATLTDHHLCVLMQERGPLSELQTALVLYECLKVIASCHVSTSTPVCLLGTVCRSRPLFM